VQLQPHTGALPLTDLAPLLFGHCKAAAAVAGRSDESGGNPKAVAAWGMHPNGGTTTRPATPKDASIQASSSTVLQSTWNKTRF